MPVTYCYSGSTAPTITHTYAMWYDTTSNKIKWTKDNGSTWTEGYSLPLAIILNDTPGTQNASSIDQIFNGFGYIGSTVFALPGVKVQTPNGRNEDGTCKSIEYTTDRMATYTFPSDWTVPYTYTLLRMDTGYPTLFVSTTVGLSDNNYIVMNGVEDRTIKGITLFRCSYTNGRINADYEPYTVDSVVNSNEFYQLRDKAVTTDTAQTISGVKTFNDGTLKALRPILLKQDNANEGGQIDFQRSNNSVLKKNPHIDLFINTIRFIGINSNNTANITLQVDLQNNQVLVPTPALTANDNQAATTAWFNSKMQVVSALPAAPDANVFYFIPE